jgi:hypothetical protein
VYNSYIRSIVEYSCANFTHVNKTTREPIFKLLKRAIRIITGAGFLDPTAILFRQEGILPLDQLIDFNVIKFMFVYRQGLQPKVFDGVWIRNSDLDHDYPLRNADDFVVRQPAAQYLSNYPYHYYVRAWNKLPANIKAIQNKKQFLTALHAHLLNLVYY